MLLRVWGRESGEKPRFVEPASGVLLTEFCLCLVDSREGDRDRRESKREGRTGKGDDRVYERGG